MGNRSSIDELKIKIADLPSAPGAYLLKDQKGEIIYVGKAKDLRRRVKSYLEEERDLRPRIRFLRRYLRDVEYIVTDTEKEALILENTLIKKHRPRYNVDLKDDKTYLNVRIDLQDPFPRLNLVRRIKKDNARYFGPYDSAAAIKETLNFLRRTFPLRTCRNSDFSRRTRPCINNQIRRCMGPCCGGISEEDYREMVDNVVLFLSGRVQELTSRLKKQMEAASRDMRFEEAALIRDQIAAIERTVEKQKVVSHTGEDQDVFGFVHQGEDVEVTILSIRNGYLLASHSYFFPRVTMPDEEIIEGVVKQFYGNDREIPRSVLLPMELEDRFLLETVLGEKRGRKASLEVPKRGVKAQVVKMASKNAEERLRQRHSRESLHIEMLAQLEKKLGLHCFPERIECFDISNTQGKYAVGSMVVFTRGEPDSNQYRRFRIRTVDQPDDYSMMYEMLKRRFEKLKEGEPLPDLALVDGGKGQLNIARKVFDELGIDGPDLAGIAKPDRGANVKTEKIFLPNRANPITFKFSSPALLLLQRIRDESHRFAIHYHRRLARKEELRSELEEIEGVGEVRKKRLLEHFGSVEEVRKASFEDLKKVPGMNTKVAEAIYCRFHPAQDTMPGDGG